MEVFLEGLGYKYQKFHQAVPCHRMNFLVESEMPPGASGCSARPGPRNQSEELEPLLRGGSVVGWADAYLSAVGKTHALDSCRGGLEYQLCTY